MHGFMIRREAGNGGYDADMGGVMGDLDWAGGRRSACRVVRGAGGDRDQQRNQRESVGHRIVPERRAAGGGGGYASSAGGHVSAATEGAVCDSPDRHGGQTDSRAA